MSVIDVAAAAGVSRSLIYQLERDEVSPSFSTLRGLAMALGTSVSVLVGDETPEEWLVVRKEGRKRLRLPVRTGESGDPAPEGLDSEGGWRIDLLPFLGSRNRRMFPVVVELEPGASTGPVPFEHEHDDFIFVTQGEVTVVRDGGQGLELGEGDAVYFIFETVTAVRNHGRRPATCLWVISPAG